MLQFRLKHPWRWRVWIALCPIWFPVAFVFALLGWAGRVVVNDLDDLCEWCREHEYVEVPDDQEGE